MKKLIFLAAVAATVVASCAKDPLSKEENVKVKEGMIPYKAAVKFAETKSTLDTDDDRKIVWEVGEKVAIFDDYNSEPNEFTVVGVSDGGAWIEGEISELAETIYGVYPYSAAVGLTLSSEAGDSLTVTLPSTQTIEAGKVIASDALVTVSDEADVYGGYLYFDNPFSVLKFTVPVDGVKKIEFSGLDGKGVTGKQTVRVDDKANLDIVVKGTSSLTVSKADGFAKNTAYYATVFSRDVQGVRFVLTADDYTSAIVSNKEASFLKSCGLTFNFTEEQINDGKVLLSGKFSVSATKQVQFTGGNLYYSTTDSTYHIESAQNETYATLGQSAYDSTHVCHFFWVTPSEATVAATAPWAATFGDHTQTEKDTLWCGEDNKLTVDGQSGLYALSKGEWTYLLSTRGTGDSYFKTGVTVGTAANCVVIAPDGYTGTIASSYTAEDWATAEASGLVCLPAAGYRVEEKLQNAGYSYYWSATPSETQAFGDQSGVFSLAYCFYYVKSLSTSAKHSRGNGYSVRLVSTVSE